VANLVKFFKASDSFGNPSSSTRLGKIAYDLVQKARSDIAGCLKVQPHEIIFTGGGSEANNLAIKGLALQHLESRGHIVTTKIEHPSVLRTIDYLEQLGFEVTRLDVDKMGRISPDCVQAHLKKNTLLVAVMAANNEIGTINPIAAIGHLCRAAGIPLVVDAIQAFGKIPLAPKEMGISLLTMSGHKIYAPKGVGALYIDEEISLAPLIHGGGQELGQRAGTENVSSIMAFGQAARLAHRHMAQENERLGGLRDYFLAKLRQIVPNLIVNGSLHHRLPNNLNVGFPGVDSGSLLLSLNQIGVYVSAGSACSAGSQDISHVIKALEVDTDHYGVIRFSFGLQTTQEDLDYLLAYLPDILNQL